MALTAAEEAELKQLQAEDAAHQDQTHGDQAVAQVDQRRERPQSATRPFSLFRATVGGLRDAAQGVIDFTEDAGNELNKRVPLPGVVFGSDAQNGVVGLASGEEINRVNAQGHKLTLPGLKGEEHAGTVERVTRAITSFVAPFTLVGKTLGIAKGASWLGRAGRAMAAGAVTDLTMDPQTTNLANVMRDTFGIHNDTLDELASEDDDNRLVARFKAAAVNAPLSLGADALLETGLRGVRAYRAWRGSLQEADAAVKAARADFSVRVPQEPVEEPVKAAATSAPKGASSAAGGASTAAPQGIEDAFDFLKRKAGEGATEQEANAFAEQFLAKPHDALSAAGINPLKVDFAALDNPEMLGKLHSELQGVYEGIANRLGRTGTVVTEQMTARAARVLATTADTLKDLYGHTSNLDSIMYASQALVGAHAEKLLGLADRALSEAKTGASGQAWTDFLEAFHRHAYFLGALRGAGSEVGRALRTLQMVQKVGKSGARRAAQGAADAAEKGHVGPDAAKELAAAAEDQVSKMTSQAEKVLFLGKLIDKGGDIGDVSRFTRAKAGSKLARLDAGLGETRGNLFAAVTAVTNALSTFTVMGLNGMSLALSSIGRMALSPFGKTYSQAARVQAMVTWAYVDGAMGAWTSAWRNTLHLLEQEGMEEVALNAEAWGAKGLALKAANAADEGRQALVGTGHFERVDVSNRTRALVMNESDMRNLNETIQSWDTPALMQHAMTWTLKAMRPALNAYGSLSRLGTILFVNAPDRLAGTIAAKAGAQAEAMRIAAHEAAELQLSGKELGTYMKARMVQLTETVDGFADDAYSAGQQQAALAAGEHEAKAALFQDPLEIFTAVDGLGRKPFVHLFVPFVKTPLRILERTAIDYTPLGFLKDRVRAAVMQGGHARDEALARIGLGTLMVYTAFQMAEDRTVVGLDGDYSSSARLSRPSYSLKVGDDQIEFKRFDPVGTLLGWGADLRAYLDHEDDVDPSQRSGIAEQYIEAAIFATQANVLSKTWLTSLKQITDLASDVRMGQSADGWGRYLASFATRFVPASGVQRSLARGAQGVDRQASGIMEGLLRQSFGSSSLPVKRDALLGRPVPVESGDRLFGMKVGPGADDSDSHLLAEMERLSFDVGKPSRSLYGVRMNSSQFSRWLELRGQVVTSPDTGMPLEKALQATIDLPAYKALPRAGKVQAIRDVMSGYSKQATMQLIREEPDLARKIGAKQVFDQGMLTGQSQDETDSQTEALFKQLGLMPTDSPD